METTIMGYIGLYWVYNDGLAVAVLFVAGLGH